MSGAQACSAAVMFGGSPFVFAHLLGHFDLLTAWPIPLFALCLRRALGNGSALAAAGCGAALAVAAYSAYYFVVYIGLMALAYGLAWSEAVSCPIEARIQSRPISIVRAVLVTLLVLDAGLIAWLSAADGGSFSLAGVTVSVRGVRNPLTVAWVLGALTLLTWWRLPLRVHPPPAGKLRGLARTVVVMAVVFSVLSAPLIIEAVRLARAGRYVSQMYNWRSAPRGIDLVTLVAGNPFHPVTGPVVARIYNAFGIDRIENAAWLGIVPLVLVFGPRGRWQDAREARCWLAVLAAAMIWALGPFAIVAGQDIGLPLPETLMRFLPVVSNARVPGRAVVIAYLALGVLGALRLPALTGRWRQPAWQWAIVAAVFLEFLGAPIPLTELVAPPVYQQLAEIRDDEAVCEVPFGIGDGLSRRRREPGAARAVLRDDPRPPARRRVHRAHAAGRGRGVRTHARGRQSTEVIERPAGGARRGRSAALPLSRRRSREGLARAAGVRAERAPPRPARGQRRTRSLSRPLIYCSYFSTTDAGRTWASFGSCPNSRFARRCRSRSQH